MKLSRDEADALMPVGEYVHTFMQAAGPGLILLGADRKREDILDLAGQGVVELAGKAATEMKHGIAAFTPDGVVFVATRENREPALN